MTKVKMLLLPGRCSMDLMPTRHSGPIQMVLRCKRDTLRSTIIKWRYSKIKAWPLMIFPETTTQFHLLLPWEISQTVPTFKSLSWMIEHKVDLQIFMIITLLNSCKTEFFFVMTIKVLFKSLMKQMPMSLVSGSLQSITCRSLIP